MQTQGRHLSSAEEVRARMAEALLRERQKRAGGIPVSQGVRIEQYVVSKGAPVSVAAAGSGLEGLKSIVSSVLVGEPAEKRPLLPATIENREKELEREKELAGLRAEVATLKAELEKRAESPNVVELIDQNAELRSEVNALREQLPEIEAINQLRAELSRARSMVEELQKPEARNKPEDKEEGKEGDKEEGEEGVSPSSPRSENSEDYHLLEQKLQLVSSQRDELQNKLMYAMLELDKLSLQRRENEQALLQLTNNPVSPDSPIKIDTLPEEAEVEASVFMAGFREAQRVAALKVSSEGLEEAEFLRRENGELLKVIAKLEASRAQDTDEAKALSVKLVELEAGKAQLDLAIEENRNLKAQFASDQKEIATAMAESARVPELLEEIEKLREKLKNSKELVPIKGTLPAETQTSPEKQKEISTREQGSNAEHIDTHDQGTEASKLADTHEQGTEASKPADTHEQGTEASKLADTHEQGTEASKPAVTEEKATEISQSFVGQPVEPSGEKDALIKLEKVAEENENLKKHIEELQAELTKNSDKDEPKVANIERILEENENLKNYVEELQAELAKHSDKDEPKVADVEGILEENENLKNYVEELQAELAKHSDKDEPKVADVDGILKENEKLKKHVEELQTELTKHSDKDEPKVAEIEGILEENEKLKKNVEELQAEVAKKSNEPQPKVSEPSNISVTPDHSNPALEALIEDLKAENRRLHALVSRKVFNPPVPGSRLESLEKANQLLQAELADRGLKLERRASQDASLVVLLEDENRRLQRELEQNKADHHKDSQDIGVDPVDLGEVSSPLKKQEDSLDSARETPDPSMKVPGSANDNQDSSKGQVSEAKASPLDSEASLRAEIESLRTKTIDQAGELVMALRDKEDFRDQLAQQREATLDYIEDLERLKQVILLLEKQGVPQAPRDLVQKTQSPTDGSEIRSALKDAEVDLKDLQERLEIQAEQHEKDISQLEKNAAKEARELEARLLEAEKQAETLRASEASHEAEAAKLAEKLRAAEALLRQKDAGIDEISSLHRQEAEKQEKKIEKAVSEKDGLLRQNEAVLKDNLALQREVEALKTRAEQAQAEKDEAKAAHEEAKAAHEEAKAAQKEAKNAQEEIGSLQAQLGALGLALHRSQPTGEEPSKPWPITVLEVGPLPTGEIFELEIAPNPKALEPLSREKDKEIEELKQANKDFQYLVQSNQREIDRLGRQLKEARESAKSRQKPKELIGASRDLTSEFKHPEGEAEEGFGPDSPFDASQQLIDLAENNKQLLNIMKQLKPYIDIEKMRKDGMVDEDLAEIEFEPENREIERGPKPSRFGRVLHIDPTTESIERMKEKLGRIEGTEAAPHSSIISIRQKIESLQSHEEDKKRMEKEILAELGRIQGESRFSRSGSEMGDSVLTGKSKKKRPVRRSTDEQVIGNLSEVGFARPELLQIDPNKSLKESMIEKSRNEDN